MRPDRVSSALILASVAATPLLLANRVFLSHDLMPKLLAMFFTGAWILFTLQKWLPQSASIWTQPGGRRFLILAAAQAASLAISTMASVQPLLSLAGTTWRRFGTSEQIAGLLIAVSATSLASASPEWRSRLLPSMSICSGIAAVYAIFQYFRVDPFLDPSLYTIQIFGGIVRPPATMGHSIYFAAWLAPMGLIALAQAATSVGKPSRPLHATVALLAAIAVILSGSRGGVLGLVIGLIFLLPRTADIRRQVPRILMVATLAIAAFTVFVFSPSGGDFRNRLYQWRQDPGGPRLHVWRDSLRLAADHPLLGTGPETFAGEFRKIESPELSRAYPDFFHETPHNVFLDALIAQGIPGLLILLSLFGIGLRGGRDVRIRPAEEGLQPAIVAIAVCSLFASFSLVEWMVLWTLCGLWCVESAQPPERALSVPNWVQVPSILAGGAMVLLAVALAYPDVIAITLSNAVNSKDAAAAFGEFDKAQSLGLGLPGYDLWRSREMAILGRGLGTTSDGNLAWKKAAASASSAEISGEDRFNATFQSAVIAITFGDLSRAESKARETIALAPNWYRPHLLLSQVLGAEGRNTESVAELRTALNLGAPVNGRQ